MKRTFLVLCILLSSYALSAQETGRIINFRSFESDTISTEATQRPQLNSIKFNLLLLPRGVFMINYERQLTGSLSLEAGLGVVVASDLLYAWYGGFRDDFGEDYAFDQIPDPSLAYEIGFKLFPSGDGFLEEVYVNPVFSYRTYRFPVDNSNGDEISGREGYDFSDFNLRFGIQTEMWFLDVYADWYVGFGFRMVQTHNVVHNYTTSTYSLVTEELRLPQFLLGVKIALPF